MKSTSIIGHSRPYHECEVERNYTMLISVSHTLARKQRPTQCILRKLFTKGGEVNSQLQNGQVWKNQFHKMLHYLHMFLILKHLGSEEKSKGEGGNKSVSSLLMTLIPNFFYFRKTRRVPLIFCRMFSTEILSRSWERPPLLQMVWCRVKKPTRTYFTRLRKERKRAVQCTL